MNVGSAFEFWAKAILLSIMQVVSVYWSRLGTHHVRGVLESGEYRQILVELPVDIGCLYMISL